MDKKPIIGVVVSIEGPALPSDYAGANVETDADGNFEFGRLPAGNYFIRARRFGFLDGGVGRTSDLGSQGVPLAIDDANLLRQVDIVLTPWADLHGTVVDEAGEPMIGIPVRAIERLWIGGSLQYAAGPIATTDDRGQYRIRVRPGSYVVAVPSAQFAVPATAARNAFSRDSGQANAATRGLPLDSAALDFGSERLLVRNSMFTTASGRPMIYAPSFYPAAASLKGARVTLVEPGQSVGSIDFQLYPTSLLSISGHVSGPPEALRNLVVRLLAQGNESLGMGSEHATAVVDGSGGFSFVGVPSGSYTILASQIVSEITRGTATAIGLAQTAGWTAGTAYPIALDSAPGGVQVSVRTNSSPNSYYGSVPAVVGDRDVTGITLTLKECATIEGEIRFPGDAPQLPLRITAEPADGGPALAAAPQAPARGNRFSLVGLREGGYFIRLAGMSQWTITSVSSSQGENLDRPIIVGGPAPGVLTVTVTDRPATVTGTISDTEHAPGGVVLVFPSDPSLWRNVGWNPPRIRRTPFLPNGQFSISRLPKGTYFAIAITENQSEESYDPAFLERASVLATKFSADWGETSTLSLKLVSVPK